MQTQLKSIGKSTTSAIAVCGILAGIATVLSMILEFPIPFMPPFLKIDFSNIPVIIGALLYGPAAGICIAFIKSTLHLLKTTTGGVGELADLITGLSLCLPVSIIYFKSRKKTFSVLCLGSVISCLLTGVIGGITNKLILIPFFCKVMPLEAILEMCGKINPLIGDINTYVLFGAIPFNFIKGALIFILSLLFFKKLAPHLKKGF